MRLSVLIENSYRCFCKRVRIMLKLCHAPSMEASLTRESVFNQIGRGFSEADACAIVELGPDATVFAIMPLTKRIAELSGDVGKPDPSSP